MGDEEEVTTDDELGPPHSWTTDGMRRLWKIAGNVTLPRRRRRGQKVEWLFDQRNSMLVQQMVDSDIPANKAARRVDHTYNVSPTEQVTKTILNKAGNLHTLDGVQSYVTTMCPATFQPVLLALQRTGQKEQTVATTTETVTNEPAFDRSPPVLDEDDKYSKPPPIIAGKKPFVRGLCRILWVVVSLIGALLTLYRVYNIVIAVNNTTPI